MLFQNSCDVPLGMTAIVIFFFPDCDPDLLQLKVTIAAMMMSIEMIFRIVSFFLVRKRPFGLFDSSDRRIINRRSFINDHMQFFRPVNADGKSQFDVRRARWSGDESDRAAHL